MYAYIIRRLLFGVLIVWGVYTITFLAVNFAPGDPFTGKEFYYRISKKRPNIIVRVPKTGDTCGEKRKARQIK